MKRFNEKEVIYTLEATQDDMAVRGNAIVSGDDAEDKKVEDQILDRLNHGDVWAWASVKVSASWNGFEGTDYLGACSYANETDFKQPGGYYDDMKAAALQDLKVLLREIQIKVCGVKI